MRAVVTRVREAAVSVEEKTIGRIERGLLVLLGVGPEDAEEDAEKLAHKICGVRVFEDSAGKMNLDLAAVGGALLVVSQFTLFAEIKGRRPSFSGAAESSAAVVLYEKFIAACAARGFRVAHGEFGAEMQVLSVNDGPVTLLFDTKAAPGRAV